LLFHSRPVIPDTKYHLAPEASPRIRKYTSPISGTMN
jgi:hypothetical protein